MRKFYVIASLVFVITLFFTANIHAECTDGKCDDGYEIRTLKDGSLFRGYPNSIRHNGQGTLKWDNGDEYVGEWKNDMMDGHGTMTWANGDLYEGEWDNDIMNGQGTYIWANGDEYEGEWKDGVQHGQGTYISANGDVSSGLFINGVYSR